MPEKVCPVCSTIFTSRWQRQVCCCRSCARKRDYARFGSSAWKGGIAKHASGYLKEKSKDHPHADKEGYVMQHRLVMEQHLGRMLERYERVHHKNGTRNDNRIENLELWTTKHKDPPGVRLLDHIADLVRQLPPNERALLRERIWP